MQITGIGGDIAYLGNQKFMIRDQQTKLVVPRSYKRVGMIAAGSGITPMFQLIQTISDAGANDTTSLSLIYSNRTPVSSLSVFDSAIVRHHSWRRSYRIWESWKAMLFPLGAKSRWKLDLGLRQNYRTDDWKLDAWAPQTRWLELRWRRFYNYCLWARPLKRVS